MSKWDHLSRQYPGLGHEDVCVKLGIRHPEIRAEVRAAILKLKERNQHEFGRHDGARVRGLRDRINAAIEAKQKEAKAKLRDEFAALCVENGTTLAEVFGTAKKPGRSMKITPMRDKKTGAIWRGIGRYPPLFDKSRAEPIA